MSWIREGNVPRIMIPAAIFPKLVAGVPAARAYAALAMRADNKTGVSDSTTEQIAVDADMSLSQAKAGVKRLIDDGWLTKIRQGNSSQSNRYQLHTTPADRSEIRPVDQPGIRPVLTQTEQSEIRLGQVGNPARTGRKSDPPLVFTLGSSLGTDTPAAPQPGLSDGQAALDGMPTTPPKTKPKQAAKAQVDPEAFDRFWAAYPKKAKKPRARTAFEKAAQSTPVEEIITAAEAYGEHYRGRDITWVPHPSTWLNDEQWADELPPHRHLRAVSGGHQPHQDRAPTAGFRGRI
ncbi:hypothetical protein [Actinoalloteichus sp. GBA129-24]|uniref:hypothetical protein n=1 Tax=Actinoalloteichus sp. GBA129-24 TaxID=1612551 RepID=UPI0009508779|nr:hypothetical protein [Actinoalloteichus sp. GBA129-24]APU20900.1 hypothetical protein UA75_14450 [Actinoalloteichus sp. GBA129-24]APU24149.1 hypothetical protein UA75_30930 [Actinoalloteichus sp. GBA129-24]